MTAIGADNSCFSFCEIYMKSRNARQKRAFLIAKGSGGSTSYFDGIANPTMRDPRFLDSLNSVSKIF